MIVRINSKLIKFVLPALIILGACEYNGRTTTPDFVSEAYRPVYGTQEQKLITLKSSQSIKNPGKIYVYGNYLLVNERQKGIHVIDNSDPKQPQIIGFIEILGNSDMAIKDEVLYANHLGNLVALRYPGFSSIEEIGKLPLKNWQLGIPPPAANYFECVDQEKGFVVAWQKVTIKNPACYAIN
jgi:hypothetical protein